MTRSKETQKDLPGGQPYPQGLGVEQILRFPISTCLKVQLSTRSTQSKATILLCPKPETKKDWLEIQKSKASGNLLSPRELGPPKSHQVRPYEIANVQPLLTYKRQFHVVHFNINIIRHWKSETTLSAVGWR